MDSSSLFIQENRKQSLNEFMNYFGYDCFLGVIITGSTSKKMSSVKSDLDLRILIRDFDTFTEKLKIFLNDKKLILFENKQIFAEAKFFFNDIPFHFLYYTIEYVEKSIKEKNRGLLSTFLKGITVYKVDEVVNPIIDRCNRIAEEIKNCNEYMTGAKSQFVKSVSRFEQKKYPEAMYCLRTATTYLIKDYLIKKGVIEIKEHWVIRDVDNMDDSESQYVLRSFLDIHNLQDVQPEQVKHAISVFTGVLSFCEKEMAKYEK